MAHPTPQGGSKITAQPLILVACGMLGQRHLKHEAGTAVNKYMSKV